jgi:hypothetical protein
MSPLIFASGEMSRRSPCGRGIIWRQRKARRQKKRGLRSVLTHLKKNGGSASGPPSPRFADLPPPSARGEGDVCAGDVVLVRSPRIRSRLAAITARKTGVYTQE